VVSFCGHNQLYDGRSINKLQNGIILLVFKMQKFWNMCLYIKDLILSTRYEFYYDATVTSFINVRYGTIAAESIP